MFRCEECADLLLDFAYDLLEPGQARQVRDHLAGCPACQAAHQEAIGQKALFAAAAQVYREIPPFAPPAESAAPSATQPVPPPATLPRVAPDAAAAARAPKRGLRGWAWIAAAAAVVLIGAPLGY